MQNNKKSNYVYGICSALYCSAKNYNFDAAGDSISTIILDIDICLHTHSCD